MATMFLHQTPAEQHHVLNNVRESEPLDAENGRAFKFLTK
jgi:hypothetical protein